MSPDRWKRIVGDVKDKFKDWEEDAYDLQPPPGRLEMITFTSPVGKMKFEFVTRPVVLDKKTNTSKRIGAHVGIQYVYSDTEETYKLTIYKWNDALGDWEQLKGEEMFSF